MIEAKLEKEAVLMLKAKTIGIFGFDGYYECFKITHQSPVLFDGHLYPSIAHAFNAARTEDETVRKRF